eukprot:7370652-Karenia_brevis.AAC.1
MMMMMLQVTKIHHRASYINPCGLQTEFDADICERGHPDHYALYEPWPKRGPDRPHQMMFTSLHSYFGVRQPIMFTKVGKKIFLDADDDDHDHDDDDDYFEGVESHASSMEPVRHADPTVPIPLPDIEINEPEAEDFI